MQEQGSRVWMLADAIAVLEGADRLRRPLFGIGSAEEGVSWEPPVDMCSDESTLAVLVALPGVSPDEWAVTLGEGEIVVHGKRGFGSHFAAGSIVLLEIPYGRFERRIRLPEDSHYRMVDMRLEHGCLRLQLERFK